MPPHLVVDQGRIKDAKFILGADMTLWRIGRERDCEIRLPDDSANPKVSRKHAVITCVDGRYFLKDGDGDRRKSHNRTRLNGEYVDLPIRKLLKHNDVIEICSYSLRFHDAVPAPDLDSPSTVVLPRPGVDEDEDDSCFVKPADKFNEIIKLLRHSFDLDALLPRVVDSLLNTFKRAERSFVILADDTTGRADVVRDFKTRVVEVGKQRPYSQKFVDECMLSNKAQRNSELARRNLCAPLLSGKGKPFGVLLLDTRTTRGFSPDDLRELEALANHVSFAFANVQYHKVAVELAERKRDLTLAAEVVKSFLPERLPEIPGYEFFAAYEPVVEVGGDYYDFVPLGGNRLGILVADVAGHGVPAALVMTRFSAQVRACLPAQTDLAEVARYLNALAQPLGVIEKFITLAVLQLDPVTHTITLVNAGHPPPLLVRRSSGAVESKNPRTCHGPMLGAVEGYEYQSHQFTLEPGDTLIVYSDGMDAAMEPEGIRPRPFSTNGIKKAVEGSRAGPRELGEQILSAWDKHAAGCRQHDDITLVCLGRGL